jgi:hypothetical protein
MPRKRKLSSRDLKEASAEIEKLRIAADKEFEAWLDQYEILLKRAWAAANPEHAEEVLRGLPPLEPVDPHNPKVASER